MGHWGICCYYHIDAYAFILKYKLPILENRIAAFRANAPYLLTFRLDRLRNYRLTLEGKNHIIRCMQTEHCPFIASLGMVWVLRNEMP